MTRQWPVNYPEEKLSMELFMHCCKQGVLAIYKGKPEFPQKLLKKAFFIVKMTGPGYGSASQF